MVGVYKIIINKSENKVYKYLSTETEVGKKLTRRLKNKQSFMYFKQLVEHFSKHPIIGNHIVEGKCQKKPGDYCSPIIKGPLLSNLYNLQILIKLDPKLIFSVIISIGILISNLKKFKNDKGYLLGDWTLHNLIFCIKRGCLVNIDLEGLYSYSPIGLSLSWDSGESKLGIIKKRLKSLQTGLIKYIVDKTKSSRLSFITIFNIPSNYQLIVPQLVEIPYHHLLKYVKYLDLTSNKDKSLIVNEKIGKDLLVFINFNNNNPYILITQKIAKLNFYKNSNLIHYFTINDNFNKIINHKYRLIRLTSPTRSKIINEK